MKYFIPARVETHVHSALTGWGYAQEKPVKVSLTREQAFDLFSSLDKVMLFTDSQTAKLYSLKNQYTIVKSTDDGDTDDETLKTKYIDPKDTSPNRIMFVRMNKRSVPVQFVVEVPDDVDLSKHAKQVSIGESSTESKQVDAYELTDKSILTVKACIVGGLHIYMSDELVKKYAGLPAVINTAEQPTVPEKAVVDNVIIQENCKVM